MVLNSGKCQYFIINQGIANEFVELGNKTLHAEAKQKRLSITIIDKDLLFLLIVVTVSEIFKKRE